MRLLMVTRADESVSAYTKYTHPILRRYAEKWGAQFKILDDPLKGDQCWRILKIYDIFEEYDRVFHIDSDVVINKDCPNMFDLVPYDTIGLVFEDKGSRLRSRRLRIMQIKQKLGGNNFRWTSGYFNMGVFLVSKIYRDMFKKIDGQTWEMDDGLEQTQMNYQMMKLKCKYVDLGYKFNHMSMFSESWHGKRSRFNSHIIHYAGGGKFQDKGDRTMTQLIKDDIARIYG